MARHYCLSLAILVFSVLGAGCGRDSRSAETKYQDALRDAAVAEATEIRSRLTPISRENADLIREGGGRTGRVLVVVWTGWNGYQADLGRETTLSREVWVTVVPEIQTFCRERMPAPLDLDLRLEQLLGLPPGDGKQWFVEMYVAPEDMFRPSPDPEIDDTTAQLDFPPDASEEHREWINALTAVSYGADGYPWTRLGYTCDWIHGDCRFGLSEFVVRAGATVGVNAVIATDDYCRPNAAPAASGE
jgi:hypothetical protein